jgi:hypothetical protein
MKAMTMFWSINAATFFSLCQHHSEAKDKVVDLPATPKECSTIQFKLNARKIGKDVASSSDRIGVGARWLLQDPELIPLSSGTCLSAAKDRQYFLLALPLNIRKGSGSRQLDVTVPARMIRNVTPHRLRFVASTDISEIFACDLCSQKPAP